MALRPGPRDPPTTRRCRDGSSRDLHVRTSRAQRGAVAGRRRTHEEAARLEASKACPGTPPAEFLEAHVGTCRGCRARSNGRAASGSSVPSLGGSGRCRDSTGRTVTCYRTLSSTSAGCSTPSTLRSRQTSESARGESACSPTVRRCSSTSSRRTAAASSSFLASGVGPTLSFGRCSGTEAARSGLPPLGQKGSLCRTFFTIGAPRFELGTSSPPD
jgi:hypothetical protein